MKAVKRTIQGLIYITFLIGFIILTGTIQKENIYYGQYFFDALLLIVSIISLLEMISAMKEAGFTIIKIPLYISIVLLYPLIKLLGYEGILLLFSTVMLVIFVFYVFDKKIKFNDFLASIFIFLYPVLPFAVAFQMINLYGMIPLLLAIGAAMMSDVFAYYFGSLIKGPKIFPNISPNKTYAGSILGLAGGIVGAIVVYSMFELTQVLPLNRKLLLGDLLNPWVIYPLLGLAISVFSELGDLAASRIKRSTGIKDFGTVMGAHGGITDRLDSMFFSIILVSIILNFITK